MEVHCFISTKTLLLLTALVLLISACFYVISDQSHRPIMSAKNNSHAGIINVREKNIIRKEDDSHHSSLLISL